MRMLSAAWKNLFGGKDKELAKSKRTRSSCETSDVPLMSLMNLEPTFQFSCFARRKLSRAPTHLYNVNFLEYTLKMGVFIKGRGLEEMTSV